MIRAALASLLLPALLWPPVLASAASGEVPVPVPNPFAPHHGTDAIRQKPLPVLPPRPSAIADPPRSAVASSPSLASSAADATAACVARLAALDIEITGVGEQPAPSDPLCVVGVPVILVGVGRKTLAAPVAMEGHPELDCSMAETFGSFVREIAVPLAKGATGRQLTGFVVGGYQCRATNRLPSGRASGHATGIALDIVAVRFSDGHLVEIGKSSAGPAAEAFLAGMRKAACGYFTTVLGPGANAEHANHLHVDIMHHGIDADDHYRICQ